MGYDDIHISLKQMDSFQAALENNKQVWNTKHFEESELLSDSLKDVSLQDVLETIVSVERSRRAKGWLGSGGSSHDRLRYLLAFIERYSKAIDCLVQTSTGSFMNPATMIWGLLRIVMEIASAATRYMTSLLNLLEDLGNNISLYSAYEDEILFDQPRFRNAMVAVYMDIINILIKARKILTKHRTRRPVFLLWMHNWRICAVANYEKQ
jgi:transcriptional regulator of met regulon